MCFIGLMCHNYALNLCFVYRPSYITLACIMTHTHLYIYIEREREDDVKVEMLYQYLPLDKYRLGCSKFHAQHFFNGFFVICL